MHAIPPWKYKIQAIFSSTFAHERDDNGFIHTEIFSYTSFELPEYMILCVHFRWGISYCRHCSIFFSFISSASDFSASFPPFSFYFAALFRIWIRSRIGYFLLLLNCVPTVCVCTMHWLCNAKQLQISKFQFEIYLFIYAVKTAIAIYV